MTRDHMLSFFNLLCIRASELSVYLYPPIWLSTTLYMYIYIYVFLFLPLRHICCGSDNGMLLIRQQDIGGPTNEWRIRQETDQKQYWLLTLALIFLVLQSIWLTNAHLFKLKWVVHMCTHYHEQLLCVCIISMYYFYVFFFPQFMVATKAIQFHVLCLRSKKGCSIPCAMFLKY